MSASNDNMAIEVWYEIRAESLKPTGRIIRHLVGPDLQVRSEDSKSLPQAGTPDQVGIPGWVSGALASSKRQFEKEHAEERERVTAAEESVKQAELQRADRIFVYRQVRLTTMIATEAEWIAEKERVGTDRERKILPARRGKLAKDKERLAQLTAEYESQVQAIKARKAGTKAIVLAAGIVVGTA
jgi:hypothetical protein